MYCLGCNGGGGSTSITAGANVTVTGTGTGGDPFIISSTGSGTVDVTAPITGDGSAGTPLALALGAGTGLEVVANTLGINLDPDASNIATLSATGLLVPAPSGTVSVSSPITGDGSGGSPLDLTINATGGLEDSTGIRIKIDPAGVGSIGADGLLIPAGGSGLYTPDNPDAWIDAFGAASAYDCEFARTTNETTLPTNWVYQNQNSATYLEQLGKGIVSIASGTADIGSVTCVVQPVSAAGTYVAAGHITTPYISGGLILTDGTKGMGILWNTNPFILVSRWTNIAGTYLDNPGSENNDFRRPEYFRITKNNANSYDFAYSVEGSDWRTLILAYDVGAFMTPTHFGFLINQGAGALKASLDWFRVR